MSDFDQLRREKTDQATYSYKASAWRSFARHAGIKTGAAAIYTIVAVAVLSVAAFVVVKMTRHAAPAPETPVENMAVATNDTVVAVETTTEPEAAIPDMPETIYCDFSGDPKAAKDAPAVESPAPAAPAAPVTPARKSKSNQPPIYGIPVVIDVDTITQMWPTDEELKEGNSRLY